MKRWTPPTNNKIEIKTPPNNQAENFLHGTEVEVYIDGQKVQNVRSVDFHVDHDSMATWTVELYGGAPIFDADIHTELKYFCPKCQERYEDPWE